MRYDYDQPLAFPQSRALAFGKCLTLASLWYYFEVLTELSAADENLRAVRRILRLAKLAKQIGYTPTSQNAAMTC
jgi:hypothetical protein